MIRRRRFSQRSSARALALLLGIAAAASCGAGSSESDDRPNIVLISIDSLRADHLGCYGYARDTSPEIDALAAEGVRCTSAASTTSWTLPAHASMFTGLPISAHGCNTRKPTLAQERRTLAESLKDAGYRTGGFWSGPYLHPVFGLGQGFDDYVNCANFDFYGKDRTGQREANEDSHGDITNPLITERVSAWLRDSAESEGGPFFLFVHMWDVHYDYIPPPPFDTRFNPGYDGPIDGRDLRYLEPNMPKGDLEQVIALYDGEIAWTDHHVGEILGVLDELGSRDNTAVILTSDHGEEFFEHGRFGHRKTLFEESVAVPLIFRYPARFEGGRELTAPVSVLDIPATILELAGAPPLEDVFGRSLVDALGGGDADGRSVVSELIQPKSKQTTVVSIRAGDWKAQFELESGKSTGAWNLATDPGERRDVAASGDGVDDAALESMRATLTELERLMERHASSESGPTEAVPQEVQDSLEALGYIGDDEE